MKDKKWTVAVEGFLGVNILRAFTVDNQHDCSVLLKIFSENWSTGSKPSIITSKFFFQVHDVSNNLVSSGDGCRSIYEVLDISDPIVANCLIDQLGIESVLLIPSTEKAIELMSDASRVPRNCHQGVTITGDKYFPDPKYRTYSSRYNTSRFLQSDTSDIIRQIENQIKTLVEKKAMLKKQQEQAHKEISEQNEQIKALDLKISKLNQNLNTLEDKYNELNSINEHTSSIKDLEYELKTAKNDIQQRQILLENIKKNMQASEENLKEITIDLRNAKDNLQGFQNRILLTERELTNIQLKYDEFSINKNFMQKRLTEMQNKHEELKSEYLSQKRKIDEESQRASVLGDRPEDLRDVTKIMSLINETNRSIRKVESSTEKPDEIISSIEEKSERYNKNVELLSVLQKDLKELHIALENRRKYYTLLKNYYVTVFSASFKNVLKLRQFKGNADVDWKNEKLELTVIPQQGSQGYTSTSNLSGGERSFSTVAFLYSLWQCMEFPFYFLDEFDVFMDKVNRTKIMEILLYHAKSVSNKQFVFLTPQDISFVHDDKVAIHRMEDPERGPTV